MGRFVTITQWPEDHTVPAITVNGSEFVIPFNVSTAIPDAHFATLQNIASNNTGIKFTDGGATGEPAAALSVPVKTENPHRKR